MKDKEKITDLVCRQYCRFYKPGEKEEMSCAGYAFFARRLSKELIDELAQNPGDTRSLKKFEHDPKVEAVLCASCPFFEDGCDFVNEEPVVGAVPCGGYMLLKCLLAAGNKQVEEWLEAESVT